MDSCRALHEPLQQGTALKPHTASRKHNGPTAPGGAVYLRSYGIRGHKTALLLAYTLLHNQVLISVRAARAAGGRPQLPSQPLFSLPDLIARLHANPLRDGPVLLLLLSEEALDLERLVGRLEERAAVSAAARARAGPTAGAQQSKAPAPPRKASAGRGWESRPRSPPAPRGCPPRVPSQPAAVRGLGVPRHGGGWRPMVSPWRGAARRPGDGGGGRGGRGGGKRPARRRRRGLRSHSTPWRPADPARRRRSSVRDGGGTSFCEFIVFSTK